MSDLLREIKIFVYYVNEKRLIWIKEQIKQLNISIEFEFVRAFTKEDGKDYIKSRHPQRPDVETEGQISCLRTFANLLHNFLLNVKDKKYIITMEDDGCLIKDGFEEKLLDIIHKYKKHRRQVDYVCLGYGPFDIEKLRLRNTGNDNDFYWGFWDNRKTNEDFDNVYGGQMLLFDRIAAKEISDVFHQKNTDEIRKKINERIDFGLRYSLKTDVLLGDHVIPLLFKQAVQYPPLCVEGDFVTSMEQGFRNFERRNWSRYIDLDEYFINNK